MAENLLRAGNSLVVHNRSRGSVDALVAQGAGLPHSSVFAPVFSKQLIISSEETWLITEGLVTGADVVKTTSTQ
jgi:hypothetical protein